MAPLIFSRNKRCLLTPLLYIKYYVYSGNRVKNRAGCIVLLNRSFRELLCKVLLERSIDVIELARRASTNSKVERSDIVK